MISRTFGVVLGLIAAFPGCDKVRSVVCEPAAAVPPTAAAAGAAAPKPTAAAAGAAAPASVVPHEVHAAPTAEPADVHDAGKAKPELLTAGARYALPFAWEKSPAEPLARARIYLRELADDNAAYMTKGPEFFGAFAATQTPRATVVTCADSRVQSPAYDATPENDDFTVRNIGNQLESSLGSVQYGVEHLNTPVLLVVGHTGCSAVKAALSDTRELEAPIRRELSGLRLKKAKGPVDDKRWAAAVLENVHDQVRVALKQFGAHVNAGELTIIGAVYDFRNDLGRGAGRLSVINVNGIEDEARLKAFGEAIMTTPNPRAPGNKKESSLDRLARALADSVATTGHDGAEEDEDEYEDEPDHIVIKPSTLPAAAAKPHASPGHH